MEKIIQSVTHILALYPFEPDLYQGTEVKCSYVGHPLAAIGDLSALGDGVLDQRVLTPQMGVADDAGVVGIGRIVAVELGDRRAQIVAAALAGD